MRLLIHGITYRSEEQIASRIRELQQLIREMGESDGRVTELNMLVEAWDEYAEEKQQQEHRAYMAEQRLQALYRIRQIEQYPYVANDGDRMIDAILANGRRRKTHYTTEKGFLKAYVRLLDSGADIVFAE